MWTAQRRYRGQRTQAFTHLGRVPQNTCASVWTAFIRFSPSVSLAQTVKKVTHNLSHQLRPGSNTSADQIRCGYFQDRGRAWPQTHILQTMRILFSVKPARQFKKHHGCGQEYEDPSRTPSLENLTLSFYSAGTPLTVRWNFLQKAFSSQDNFAIEFELFAHQSPRTTKKEPNGPCMTSFRKHSENTEIKTGLSLKEKSKVLSPFRPGKQ